MPWVRLHGVKDYLDLVLILERYPNLHQTVNLVPSLIMQLEDYVSGEAMDPYLELTLKKPSLLTDEDKEFIYEHFFDGNHHTLIDPHPRYSELYHQKHDEGKQWCLEHWQLHDYEDLLAWHNLSWIDPMFWDDPEVAGWLEQGRNFSLSDRQKIWKKQQEIIARIIPQHKKMQDSGQLEITTTPYTHPILPLLSDTDAGRVAVPQMPLPENRFQWHEDIPRHLEKAWDMYKDRFGMAPKGLWPSEQSVSPAILDSIRDQGFRWICSDEAVLGCSLNHYFYRDEYGNVKDPELMYRPYRLPTNSEDLAIVFRDHRLSDLIGFSYSHMEPNKAAADMVGHLESIHYQFKTREDQHQPWLVTIALDGENCWEFYEKDGLPFLSALYEKLNHHSEIKLVTVSEFLDKYPARHTIERHKLHSGSWVDGSFTTWIGDPAKNKAWDLLHAAREMMAKHPEATEKTNPDAWEALYAAEGSDWFWWFGKGHSSSHDALFDQLFREHLQAIYTALDEPIPDNLLEPVEDHNRAGNHLPEGFIHPYIDGYGDEQDWERAGRFELGGARGTMHQSSDVQALYYGLDHSNFYIRLDIKSGLVPGQGFPSEVHLLWYYPDVFGAVSKAPIGELPDEAPLHYQYRHHLRLNLASGSILFQEAKGDVYWETHHSGAAMCFKNCLEVSVPWADLRVEPDQPVRLTVVLGENDQYKEHILGDRLIEMQVP
jgi:alpha-amylase/alpha-mannosidase (GH57 family)